MHVNTEGTNTQKMLHHNQAKDRTYADSLQRKTTDLVHLSNGRLNIDFRESAILNSVDFSKDQIIRLFEALALPPFTLLSDVDPQVFVKLKFIDKVDCARIIFHPPSATEDDASFGRRVKLFVNHPEMDFSDASHLPPAAELQLPEVWETRFEVPLAGSRFARISSIQILVEDNWADTERSAIGRVTLEGLLTATYEYK